MVRRMKDMTKPHPRCCCAAVWGCGHGPETPGWSRSGSFDLLWRDFSQIDVIAHIAYRPPISVVCVSTGGFLTRQTRVFHSIWSYLGSFEEPQASSLTSTNSKGGCLAHFRSRCVHGRRRSGVLRLRVEVGAGAQRPQPARPGTIQAANFLHH